MKRPVYIYIYICVCVCVCVCACILGLYSCGNVEEMEGCIAKKAIGNPDELTYEVLSS
jgi:hypothetical protein